MKKRIIIISVVLAALLTAGCSSAPKTKIYDKSVSKEQSSTLRITDCDLNMIDYESFMVNNRDLFLDVVGVTDVVIPAGTHTLKLSKHFNDGDYLKSFGAIITYQFLPGHTYLVTINPAENVGIIIDYLAFDEFIPNPDNSKASPLEGVWVDIKNSKNTMTFVNNEYSKTDSNGRIIRGKFTFDGHKITFHLYEFIRVNGFWHLYDWRFGPRPGSVWQTSEFDGTTGTTFTFIWPPNKLEYIKSNGDRLLWFKLKGKIGTLI